MTHPHIYENISKNTRVIPVSSKPKAVLFEGPPGTGKTTSARIIAHSVQIPCIYIPIESILSKYYGESEKKLSELFDYCEALGKSIIFIDEIDSVAGDREGAHEASKRVLSTLLRRVDGMETDGEVMVIAATNRKHDLDVAMLSRIDLSILFALPD